MRIAAGLLLVAGVAHAAPTERRLHIAQAEASSFDKNDYNRFEENYLPLYVADDDPTTGWVEGAPGDGTGSWLRVRFTQMQGATKVRLKIKNGYQKSDKLFAANERAKDVTFKLLPSGVTVKKTLKDVQGFQEVVIDQPAGVVAGVEMTFDSIYKGTRYEDLTISDVQVFVTAETPDNPAFEKSIFDKTKKWKADRITAAKAFAEAAKTRPLVMQPSYEVTSLGEQPGSEKVMYTLEGQLDRLFATKLSAEQKALVADVQKWLKAGAFEPVRVSAAHDAKFPAVDGLCAPSVGTCEYDGCGGPMATIDNLAMYTTDSYRVIEDKTLPKLASPFDDGVAKKWKACHDKDGGMLSWAVRDGDDKRTRAVVMLACGMAEGREGRYLASSVQVLAYDASGHLSFASTTTGSTTYTWKDNVVAGGSWSAMPDIGTFTAAPTVAKK